VSTSERGTGWMSARLVMPRALDPCGPVLKRLTPPHSA
jgi:hypothetical protein